ncbi:hypothetical protein [Microbacterium sp. No. 7]|uniref:hypothetical protein n=1 Tax=Microbacterium sp. No. 7 TaxID=1714373 RepID=UPI0006ECE56C|nr:hypothetical protein [Microbacterium sp. No. 7]ALJ22083.1 hypothetical protein AOA12_20195 [Microbacterium sp. No. 7]
MGYEHGFDAEDAEELMYLVHDGDSNRIAGWMEQHIRSYRDMHALFKLLTRMIAKSFPLALTKGVNFREGDLWVMEDRGATPAARDAARMMTVAMNGDDDTLTALILAALTQPEEHHAAIAAYLLAAWGDGLRAITEMAGHTR